MTVRLTIKSNSGLSVWDAEIDFNDYGHISGSYWLTSENPDSTVPDYFGDLMQDNLRKSVATSRWKEQNHVKALQLLNRRSQGGFNWSSQHRLFRSIVAAR